MEKLPLRKRLLTATNIIIMLLVVLYLFDCYLPLPEGYTATPRGIAKVHLP